MALPTSSAMALLLLFVVITFLQRTLADGGFPKIKGELKSQLVAQEGQDVTLSCPVERSSSLMIEWYKDGSLVNNVLDNFKASRKGGLLLFNVTEEESGTYVCRAVNGFGVAEVSISLTVQGEHNGDDQSEVDPLSPGEGVVCDADQDGRQPEVGGGKPPGCTYTRPFFTSPPFPDKDGVILRPLFGSVRFKCAAGGHPRPQLRWLKDGRELRASELDADVRLGRWTINLDKLRTENSGRYTCEARNGYGQVNATFVLNVVAATAAGSRKPEFTSAHPQNTTVDFGATASFQCRVKSDAKPHIQWLKKLDEPVSNTNGTLEIMGASFKVLSSSEVVERGDGSFLNKLILTDVRENDSGMYLCLAANNMGYNYKEAFLVVHPVEQRSSSDMAKDDSVGALSLALVIAVPSAVILLVVAIFAFFHCRGRCSSAVNGSHKPPSTTTTTIAATSNGNAGSMPQRSLLPPAPSQQQHLYPSSNCSQRLMVPASLNNGVVGYRCDISNQQWVDLPPSQPSSNPSSALLCGGNGVAGSRSQPSQQHSYRLSGATTPSSSTGTSNGAGLPRVHQHHHHHHHQYRYN